VNKEEKKCESTFASSLIKQCLKHTLHTTFGQGALTKAQIYKLFSRFKGRQTAEDKHYRWLSRGKTYENVGSQFIRTSISLFMTYTKE
jgi:hypothetical protein